MSIIADWMVKNDVYTVSVEEAELYFSLTGCDITDNGLANNVYNGIAHRNDGTEFEVKISHNTLADILHGEDDGV